MISSLRINGFRSLADFSIHFRPGLNVLVGPNGSGKTNIVLFFEFLAHLMSEEVSTAVYKAGGAGAIFRKEHLSYNRRISATVAGEFVHTVREYFKGKAEHVEQKVEYEYSFVLCLSSELDKVTFESQVLKVRYGLNQGPSLFEETESPTWNLHVTTSVDEQDHVIASVHAMDSSIQNAYPFRNPGSATGTDIADFIGQVLSNNPISLPNYFTRSHPSIRQIASDLTGGQIYNIVPTRLKSPEDSAKPPGVSRDGTGLAATLFAAQKSAEQNYHYAMYRPSTPYHRLALTQIKEYLQLVNPSVSDFTASNDAYENQVRIQFSIKSGGYTALLPMSLMSDGTLKWLALITAAVTSSSILCIEEPENYLHPQMQSKMIDIFRQILFDSEKNKFTLLTTHSETLLNHCKPDELIIVSMLDGKTKALRCTNAEDISREIRTTGFGLGYYYISDALQHD